MKDGAQLINLDQFKSIGTHGIVLFGNGNKRRESFDAVYSEQVSTTLNYLEHFLVLACTITGCTSIPAFASFLELQVSMPQQLKKKKNDKIVLSAKS